MDYTYDDWKADEARTQMDEERLDQLNSNYMPSIDFDYSKITNMDFEDIDFKDYPDFCDAYCSYAEYNGEPMTEEELEDLNINHSEFVYEQLINHIF